MFKIFIHLYKFSKNSLIVPLFRRKAGQMFDSQYSIPTFDSQIKINP